MIAVASAVSALGVPTAVLAADGVGLYVGATAGQARTDAAHSAGWQVLAGVRPLNVLGAEFDYVDFGHASGTDAVTVPYHTTERIDTAARGGALFAVGYVPVPVAYLDFYGKAGLARIQSKADGSYQPIPIDTCYYNKSAAGCPLHVESTNTGFAWGLGTQLTLSNIALRAEYERFTVRSSHPALLSLGVTWRFL
jgi:opacity protein-like surface antigen